MLDFARIFATQEDAICAGKLRSREQRQVQVRAVVEHVFARQKGPMGLFVRTIGIARATVKIGLANIAYNMKRAVWLTERAAIA